MAQSQSVEDLPFLKEQKQGIEDIKKQLSMQQGLAGKGDDDYWIKPLLNLTDAQTGSHMLPGYTPPQSQNAKLIALQTALQQKQGDYAKNVLSGIKDLKSWN